MSITLRSFFEKEVKPALGCTEPVAVALAVAKARSLLPITLVDPVSEIGRLEVKLGRNVYKNGDQVGIPGTNGRTGNAFAAALALCMGDPLRGLEIFQDIDDAAIIAAERLSESNKVVLVPDAAHQGVYIDAFLRCGNHRVQVRIEGDHTHFTYISVDDVVSLDLQERCGESLVAENSEAPEALASYGELSYESLLELVKTMDPEDVEYLWKGIRMNRSIAEYGLTHDVGIGLGRSICGIFGEGSELSDCISMTPLSERIKGYCTAASDARMHGVPLPVMSSAGSGNHGIVTIIPVALYGEAKGFDPWKIATGILVSHLSCFYIKRRLGRLSAVCGCSIAAGAAAAAGIAYMETSSVECCGQAMLMVLSNLAGMICDGAKFSCSFKVGTGAEEAYRAAQLAISGKVMESQGIVDKTLVRTISNVAVLNSDVMCGVDHLMLDILSSRSAGGVHIA